MADILNVESKITEPPENIVPDENILKLCCVSAASNYRADSLRFVRHFLLQSEALAMYAEEIEVLSLRSIPNSHCSMVFIRNKALNLAIVSIGGTLSSNVISSMSNFVPVDLPSIPARVPGRVMAYVMRLAESFFTSGNGEWVKSITDLLDENTKIIFTGHSLGGSVTMLITLVLLASNIKRKQNMECITFGSALFADAELSDYVKSSGWADKFLTVVNNNDSIPRLPFLPEARTEVLGKLNRMFPIGEDRPELVFPEAEHYARRDKHSAMNPFSARALRSRAPTNNFSPSVPVGQFMFLTPATVLKITRSAAETIQFLQMTASDAETSLSVGLNDHGLIRGYFRSLGISAAPQPLVGDNVLVSIFRNWFSGVDVWMKVWMTIAMDGEHLRAFLRDEVNFYDSRVVNLNDVTVSLESAGQVLCFRSKLKHLQQKDCILKVQIPKHVLGTEWVSRTQELLRYAKKVSSASSH